MHMIRGGSRIFSRGGGFSKNFVDLFLDRPNWFSERSKNFIKTLILTKVLRRKKNFETKNKSKMPGKPWNFLTKKLAFFGRAVRQKKFRPKMDVMKQYQRVSRLVIIYL